MLLDSLDSVAEVNLDEQDQITPKPRGLPEMTENEMTGTGKNVWKPDCSLNMECFMNN